VTHFVSGREMVFVVYRSVNLVFEFLNFQSLVYPSFDILRTVYTGLIGRKIHSQLFENETVTPNIERLPFVEAVLLTASVQSVFIISQ